MMIEVPSAAVMADAFAREVDFFSIGTNDLIQYSLAVDRGNEHVSHLYSAVDPAVLRMMRLTLSAADAAGIDCSICGEMAGDILNTILLVGMGFRKLSMTPERDPGHQEADPLDLLRGGAARRRAGARPRERRRDRDAPRQGNPQSHPRTPRRRRGDGVRTSLHPLSSIRSCPGRIGLCVRPAEKPALPRTVIPAKAGIHYSAETDGFPHSRE